MLDFNAMFLHLGLYLYANCELLAVSGFGRGCDVCTRSDCHQHDKNTHLMFGRPNKGPHFKLTHFSAGDITIYEDFFATDRVTQLCGSNNGKHGLQQNVLKENEAIIVLLCK